MPTALVIGASRGIGREFVRQLLAGRWQVYATARDDGALASLKGEGGEPLKLDVTQPDMLAGLGWQLDGVKLDLAIYVAGIYGAPHQDAKTPPTQNEFDALMHANVLGAMQAIALIAPMVEAAAGRFVFISSGMGSIGETESSYGWQYRVSKAALNMAVRSASFDYPGATMAVLCPGWVKTDMGGPGASLSVDESVTGLMRVIETLMPADTGTFRNHAGRTVDW